jgi:hypothetical protein
VSEYWFARRFPVGHPRNAVAPVTREGWLAFAYWGAGMLAGSAIFLWLAVSGALFGGLIVFVVVGIAATWVLMTVVGRHSDNARTVEDYRRMQAGGPV